MLKKSHWLIILCWPVFFPFLLNGQKIGPVQLFVDVTRFYNGADAYAEVQFYVAGNSLVAIPTPDSLWESSLDVLLYFKRDSAIVQYDHLVLHSPKSGIKGQDFVDIRRYVLPAGNYQLRIEAFDVHQSVDTLIMERTLVIEPSNADWTISDPMLLMSVNPSKDPHPLLRNGYLMEPLPHRYYSGRSNMLYFYQEVYCNEEEQWGKPYQFDYHLVSITGNTTQRIQQAISKRRRARMLDPVLIQIDIQHLPSGNYALVTEIRDTLMQLLGSRKIAFQRSNPALEPEVSSLQALEGKDSAVLFLPELDEEALNYALRATAPRVWDKEVDLLNVTIQNKNLDAKRHFLHNFFLREDANQPGKAYEKYIAIADVVDKQYKSGFGYGFESDRGFALMKYGKPNDIIDIEDEPHAPPYQIWLYNEFPYTGQRNVKFLFYNPSLAPGNYELLHSTARNERNNPRWEIDLYSKLGGNEIQGGNYQDATQVTDQYYRMARRYFEDN